MVEKKSVKKYLKIFPSITDLELILRRLGQVELILEEFQLLEHCAFSDSSLKPL